MLRTMETQWSRRFSPKEGGREQPGVETLLRSIIDPFSAVKSLSFHATN